MCDITVAYMAMAASGVMSAKAQIDQGNFRKEMATYNAAVDRNKAIQVENKAREAESAEREKAQQLIGKQRAIAASRGARVDFGTALQLQEDAEMIGEMNAMRIKESSDEQVAALESSALITEAEGSMAQQQGYFGAASTVLSTAGSIGMMSAASKVDPSWYQNGLAPSGAAGFGPAL